MLHEMIWFITQQNDLVRLAVELAIVVVVTGILRYIWQPLLIGYLFSGIIIWPFGLWLIQVGDTSSFVKLFSELGIALLLFTVGLWLNPKVIKEHGKTSLGIGIAQIAGTTAIGFLRVWIGWFSLQEALYLSVAFTFSSTIVVIKLLSDKWESDTVYGKLATGILIIQDLVVMLLLMFLSIGGAGWHAAGHGADHSAGFMLSAGIALVVTVIVMSRYGLPVIMRKIAWNEEFILLIGMTRCLLLGALFQLSGFSFEIWCLLAGMSFAASPFRIEITNRLKSLRDFFVVLFFLNIGMQLSFSSVMMHIRAASGFVVFVIVVKTLIVYYAAKIHGFTVKTSLKTALSLSQISEFSFLLVSIGIAGGQISDPGLLSVVMFVWLITICFSSYVTLANNKVYLRLIKKFPKLFRSAGDQEDLMQDMPEENVDVVLFWYGRIGSEIAEFLTKNNISFVVVDHNPNLLKPLKIKWIPYIFADAWNHEMYQEVFRRNVKMVISTIKDFDDDYALIHSVKRIQESMIIAVVATHSDEALDLYHAGADYVIMPDELSAHHTSSLIERLGFDIVKFVEHKVNHMQNLQERIQRGLLSLLRWKL